MEELGPAGLEAKEEVVMGQRHLCAGQAGVNKKSLCGAASQPIRKEPDGGLQDCWESQWQEFLRTVQPPQSGWEIIQVPRHWMKEDTKDFQASFKTVVDTKQWFVTKTLSGLSRGAQEAYQRWDLSMTVKEEALDEEDATSLESRCQRFRHFCYEEAEGPQEALNCLQRLCHQWLEPQRHTKEEILELVMLEQFLTILPQEMQAWVRERGPATCNQVVDLAEDFLLRLEKAAKPDLKVVGPWKVVAADNSWKLEQDSIDATESPHPVEVKKDEDGKASMLSKGLLLFC
uniref:SCAN box domain-containing protein n=1 Tax=Salvator merianae TaxID=96440 RepID=A0A8D0BNT1_SALMN